MKQLKQPKNHSSLSRHFEKDPSDWLTEKITGNPIPMCSMYVAPPSYKLVYKPQ